MHNPPGLSGEPLSSVRVRGTTSIVGGNDPLVIIDGVTEAMNLQDQLYSEERLLSDVTDLRQLGIHPLVEGIVSRAKEFAGTTYPYE